MDNGSPARSEKQLEALAQAARERSGAAGVAIALRRDGAVVCVARAGEMAPSVGASAEGGISGEALRVGELLRCPDTENDDRVNVEVCRQLGIRSMVLVPIRQSGSVVGLVSAYCPEPDGFDEIATEILTSAATEVTGEPALASTPAPPSIPLPVDVPEPQLRGPLRIATAIAAIAVIASVAYGVFLHGGLGQGLRANPQQQQLEPPTPSSSPASESPSASFIDGLSSAAASGDAAAQKELGDAYASGHGVERDIALASAWYILAAENGNDTARDAAKAVAAKMSSADVAKARYELGRMYAAGRGTKPDRIAAYTWFLLAQELGSAEANQAMAILRQLMTPEQVQEANQRASAWLMKHRRTQP